MQLPVNEIFNSLQGEGSFTGWPAVFVRFQGCRQACSFCDTKYAQNLKRDLQTSDLQAIFQKKKPNPLFAYLSVEEIFQEVLRRHGQSPMVILTGGEPALYDLSLLGQKLCQAGLSVHLETSGSEILRLESPCWITLSPKKQKVVEENWQKASEIKLVISEKSDLEPYLERLKKLQAKIPICLQPQSLDPVATTLCAQLCQKYNFRLSLQTHKFINIP